MCAQEPKPRTDTRKRPYAEAEEGGPEGFGEGDADADGRWGHDAHDGANGGALRSKGNKKRTM